MKALKALLGLASRSDAASGELEDALADARAEAAAAASEAAKAEARYREGLLSLDEKALAQTLEAQTAAKIRHDRATALVERLEEQHAAAVTREAEAARVERYSAAQAASEAAMAKLRNVYPKAAAEIVSVLLTLADARDAVDAANADLPAGAERLRRPEEAVRSLPGMHEEVLSERRVMKWVFSANGNPLDDQAALRVREHPERKGHGVLALMEGGGKSVERREFIERVIVPQELPRWVTDLAASVVLPELVAGMPPFWSGCASGEPHAVRGRARKLAEQAEAARQAPAAARQSDKRVELVPVDKTQASTEAA